MRWSWGRAPWGWPAAMRWPGPSTVGGWTQGVPLDYARELCEYWRTRYSWRRCEAELNALPQF